MIDLNKEWIDIECPKCGYKYVVQLIDVKTERIVFCHNCKSSIQLIDEKASTYTGINNINNALKTLEETLNKL